VAAPASRSTAASASRALTGRRLGAADALYCGLATHFVAAERLPALTAALAEGGRDNAGLLAELAGDPGPAVLPPLQAAIDRCFGGASVEAIIAALAAEDGAWARKAQAAMERASPTSLKITLRQLDIGRQLEAGGGLTIEAALALEYRMTQHCLAAPDFLEGIRAQLIDKDRHPRWQPATLGAVSESAVEGYFAPLGARELSFS